MIVSEILLELVDWLLGVDWRYQAWLLLEWGVLAYPSYLVFQN